jgi:hypothetical protein
MASRVPRAERADVHGWQRDCFLSGVRGPQRTAPPDQREQRTMSSQDFYGERKWCEQCKDYVRYLMSVDHSFCVHCGTKVRLFSKDDQTRFSETVQRHRWQAS